MRIKLDYISIRGGKNTCVIESHDVQYFSGKLCIFTNFGIYYECEMCSSDADFIIDELFENGFAYPWRFTFYEKRY